MATSDRQTPSPDTFLCRPWSSFVRAAELHCEKRHSSPAVSSRGPLVPMKPGPLAVAPAAPGAGEALSFRVPKDFPHSRFSKAPLAVYPPKGVRTKPCVSLPVVSLEKMPCLNKTDTTSPIRLPSSSSSSSTSSSPSRLKPSLPQRHGEKLSNGHCSSSSSTAGPPTPADRRPSPARSPLGRRPPSTPSPSRSPSLNRRPSPSPSPSLAPRPPGAPLPSPASSALTPSQTLAMSSPAPHDRKQQNGAKVPARPHKCLSGRVFDPNKHCGVQDPETKRQCTRSLTCKTHSLTHRRAVHGRRRPFDLLLAEHKGRTKKEKEAQEEAKRDRDSAQGRKEALTSPQTTTPSRPHCSNGRLLSTLKLQLANAHIPRVPGSSATSAPPQPSPAAAAAAGVLSPASANPPHAQPPLQGWPRTAGGECGARLSSDDNEEDEGRAAVESPEADADGPLCPFYSAHHPRPLGCCRFGNRLMGRGSYVFDRRWDRVRLALHSMVETHLNAHMWRKVPLAAETPLSPRTPASPSLDLHPRPPPSSPQSSVARDRSQPVALASPRGKPRNLMHAPNGGGGPWREKGDQTAVARKRKMTSSASLSSSSSSSSSSPTSSPSADNLRKNGSGIGPGSRATPSSSQGWKRSLMHGVGGSGSREEERTSREERPRGYSLLYR
ncbi:Ataxin-7-like protein 1 [Merluccius polli]|uniref:Ataxin-7-like protein 1 n=1 Tax=Merluccius polli TaxID=89951 RepID=A0AA47M0F4_MERPO|nr:Ataxin-7-like protein 1 [Merluccius polli]